MSGSKVVHQDGRPLAVYRGQCGGRPDCHPFDNTREGTPTFTPSLQVALVYAKYQAATPEMLAGAKPHVSECYLDIRNPLELEDEGWVTYEELAAKFDGRVSMERFVGVMASIYLEPDEGTHTHEVLSSNAFVELAHEAGYDGVHYWGDFVSEHLFEMPQADVIAEGGYKDLFCEEWRPFRREQVQLLRIVWP